MLASWISLTRFFALFRALDRGLQAHVIGEVFLDFNDGVEDGGAGPQSVEKEADCVVQGI